MSKKIVCIGDSNTWGYDPRSYAGEQYPPAVRWTARIDNSPAWEIISLAQNGRAIPQDGFGLRLLDLQLDAAAPFDGVCVMLGANDLLCGASAQAAAAHMDTLLAQLKRFGAPVLLIAPPPFQSGTWVEGDQPIAASVQLAKLYRTLAQDHGIAFADAGEWGIALAFDGVHFTEEGHLRFAEHAAQAFAQAFGA